MCGLFGMATCGDHRLESVDGRAAALRDLLAHRGPDDAGLWRSPGVALAHRRLAVVDPTPAGRQPMSTPDGRYVVVYNGELYNDADLRSRLGAEQPGAASICDTTTVLRWLARHGPEGLASLRGMYALAFLDTHTRRLWLARDPLGIKPLYWWAGFDDATPLLVFASEPGPILAHPAVPVRPDISAVSAYLTTIRTTLGERTLFEGVRTLPPGGVLSVDLAGDRLTTSLRVNRVPGVEPPRTPAERVACVRQEIERSVALHLRSDVPTCCLLSGGLDSAIVTSIARGHVPGLRTYCAGAAEGSAGDDDLSFADRYAAGLGLQHTRVEIDRPLFHARWAEMVRWQGVPLSTPNEVAINEVARRLRAEGHVVALSGEGADELFGGYDHPLGLAAAHVEAGNPSPGRFQLEAAAWCPPGLKASLLTEEAWRACDADADLLAFYDAEFAAVSRGDDPLADHLRFQRRVNLAGLLQRLDTATMLESVEGRTPFADVCVAALAESIPIAERFAGPGQTKLALRRAFADSLPPEIVSRPKASFPLPFQSWVAGAGGAISCSGFLRELVRPEALALVGSAPTEHWRLAWPLANLALWAERWWPDGAAQTDPAASLGAPSPMLSIQ